MRRIQRADPPRAAGGGDARRLGSRGSNLPSANITNLAENPRTEPTYMVAQHRLKTTPRLRRDLDTAQKRPIKIAKDLQQTGPRHLTPLLDVGLRTQSPKRVPHFAGRPLDLIGTPLTRNMLARV